MAIIKIEPTHRNPGSWKGRPLPCVGRAALATPAEGENDGWPGSGSYFTDCEKLEPPRHDGACSFEPVAAGGVEPERVGSASAGCVVACGGFGCDPRAGWWAAGDVVPGGCVDPSVDGVAACPCWASAVVVWRVLRKGETASPADSAGVGVCKLADGGGAGVKRAGMVARFHALIGAKPQGWGWVESLRRGQGHRPRSSGSPPDSRPFVYPRGDVGERNGRAVSWRHDPKGKAPTPLRERLRSQARRVLTARR